MSADAAPPQVRKLATTVWWVVLVQGVLAVLFGIVAMVSTGATLLTMLLLFGVYSIVDGVVSLFAGIRNRDEGWGWLVFQGIAGIAVGLIAVRYPGTAAVALTLVVALWALVIGLIRIWGAFELRRLGAQGWIWALVAGIAAVIFGLFLVIDPTWGAETLIWLIGITSLVFGIALIVNAILVRKVVEDFADDGVINGSNA
jgi:uncharacterized membrane protein HdeD (DUF308 family)